MFTIGLAVGFLVYLAYLASRSVFRIQEGHVGVVTTLGAALREPGQERHLKLFPPGLHYKMPWQKFRSISLMEEIIDLSGPEGARVAMAADGTTLRLDAVLRYLPVPEELYNLIFDMAAPQEHITGLFTCLLRSEIANFRPANEGRSGDDPALHPSTPQAHPDTPGGSYALLQRERRRLNEEIMEYCKGEIGSQYGVRFSAVDLVDISPPAELDEALNAAVHAQMNAETTYAHAEAAAERKIIASQRGVEVAELKALAVEDEIRTLTAQLEELEKDKTLELYVARRNAEVLSQSKHHYVRRGS